MLGHKELALFESIRSIRKGGLVGGSVSLAGLRNQNPWLAQSLFAYKSGCRTFSYYSNTILPMPTTMLPTMMEMD